MSKQSEHGSKSLVIVESPSKARTINRYLGPGYTVLACMGHVRDLPKNDIGIDFEHDFEPIYETLPDKRKALGELRRAAGKAPQVFLATDLDREGEAIAWHLVHALGLDPARARRVVFNEITKSAIGAAFQQPRGLDMDKVEAQQARRLLDRIVGYQLSPLLCAKISNNLSAGRVQSVAVRLVVEREREIRSFIPQESWGLHGCFTPDLEATDRLATEWARLLESATNGNGEPKAKERNAWLARHGCVYAQLTKLGGIEFRPANVQEARAAAELLGFVTERVQESAWEAYAGQGLKTVALIGRTDRSRAPAYHVKDVQKRRTSSRPGPPFTTATLQQAASGALGFAPARTMRVAQELYEGVDLGKEEGPVGLITYMRTDSTNLSQESVQAIRGLVGQTYGPAYVPEKPNVFARGKRAQEAHEAIRPTDVTRTPEALRGKLSDAHWKLYDLIWRRAVASQMTPAQWDATTMFIAADTPRGEALFKALGRRLVFDGFQRVSGTQADGDVELPALEPGQRIAPLAITPKQEYTSPPPRYTEASLVKKLEAEGIGRPSTYAAIIQTIQDRGYVDQIDRRLYATDKGEIVTDKLVEHFPRVLDVKFTSHMEDELDKIEEAHLNWVEVLREFYGPFKESLERAQVQMEPARSEPSPYTCNDCGRPMVYRWGRNGRFLSCSGYPECKSALNIDREGKPLAVVNGQHSCPQCGRDMVVRQSRRGPFLGCSGYPECSYTVPCDERGVPLRKVTPAEIRENCPECGAPMVVRFGRGGTLLGCSKYPKCRGTRGLPPGVYVEKPKPEPAGVRCDKCGRPMVIRKSRRGPFLSCSGFPRCRNAMPLDKLDELKAKEQAGEVPPPPAEPNPRLAANGTRAAGKKAAKVDMATLGDPPAGFAWTRTGRPVIEVWPEGTLHCPACGSEMAAKNGRFGAYFSCTNYPRCRFTANLRGEAKKHAEVHMPAPARPKPIPTDIRCTECGAPMLVRTGRTGTFLGCSGYPKCKAAKPLPEGLNVEALTAGAAAR
ncbi:MAG TPA: type I DNA topoisomerase [Phycisphaerae bacterium]|nr:type I DNA topoisomerase [Phycisphaerae bacterium]HNU46107.1 type I DNA topoisomerase [Phycisphaerae bacterium]